MIERIKPRNERDRDDLNAQIAELEQGLRIDKNGLDDALEQQPDLYYRVAKLVSLEMSRRDALKQELEEVEAEVDERVRIEAESAKEKLTETEAKMRVRLDPKLKRVRQDILRANRRVGDLQALEKSFTQRSYAIKELVSLYVSQYFGDNTGGGSRTSSQLKTRSADEVRRTLAEGRRYRDYNR